MAARYARAANLLWRRTASSVVLRTIDGRGATLRGTAPAVWDELEHPSTLDELVVRLRRVFTDPDGTLAQDTEAALNHLVDSEVVVVLGDA